MFIEFTVPGEPVAKGRARAFIRCGKIGHYTPDKTANYESLVRLFASRAMGNKPLMTEAIWLTVDAYFSIPRSWSVRKQEDAEVMKIRHLKKPDLTNILKSVEDAMNGVYKRGRYFYFCPRFIFLPIFTGFIIGDSYF